VISLGGIEHHSGTVPDGNFLAFASSHEGNRALIGWIQGRKLSKRLTVRPSATMTTKVLYSLFDSAQ